MLLRINVAEQTDVSVQVSKHACIHEMNPPHSQTPPDDKRTDADRLWGRAGDGSAARGVGGGLWEGINTYKFTRDWL